MTFAVTPLQNEEFLVEGTDSKGKDGTIVLHSPAWAAYQYATSHRDATGEFNEAVLEMFKPITEAADKAKAKLAALRGDDFTTITVTEGIEAVQGETVHLDPDGVLLNIIHLGKDNRLRWVGDRLVAIQ